MELKVDQASITVEAISPVEAKLLLAANTKNRNLIDNHADAMISDMKDGSWVFDGSPIRIAADGVLLDGQHRLTAVVKSGTTQTFLVVKGLDHETRDTMDTNAVRTLKSLLEFKGEKNTSQLAAILVRAYRWDNEARGTVIWGGKNKLPSGETMTRHTLLRYFEEHADELRAAATAAKSPASGITPAAYGLAYLVLNRVDETAADDFFRKLKSGAGLDEKSPILKLRERLFNLQKGNGTIASHVPLGYLFKAWNLYRDGAEISMLRYTPGGPTPEVFPEPR